MNEIILAHVRNITDFRNLASILETEINEKYFTKRPSAVKILTEMIYLNSADESCYFHSKREGYNIEFYPFEEMFGKRKMTERFFHEGVLDGYYVSYYGHGNKKSEGNYINKNQHGLWTVYLASGEKQAEYVYNNGVIISQNILIPDRETLEYLEHIDEHARLLAEMDRFERFDRVLVEMQRR